MIGKTYGRLTVVKRTGRRVLCKCSCGTTKEVDRFSVLRGDTQSCGCLQKERTRETSTTHGGHRLPEYRVWRNILSRCYNKNDPRYDRYGGRGITVYSGWRRSFEAFLRDVGPRPGFGYSIDRIDNDRGYEPGNMRWATAKEQARNRSTNKLVTHNNKTQTIAEWAEELELEFPTLARRLRRWPVEKALTSQHFR